VNGITPSCQPLNQLRGEPLGKLAGLRDEWRPYPDPRALSVGIVHLFTLGLVRSIAPIRPYIPKELWPATTALGGSGVLEHGHVDRAQSPSSRSAGSARLPLQRDVTNVVVVGAVREVLFALRQPEELLDRVASSTTRVVTLTVAEKGYRLDPSSGRLSTDDPELIADASGRPPKTVMGQLVSGLEVRRRRQSSPLTVVCCDNLRDNGATLDALVTDFCG
jgi:fructuronate reductase